MERLKGLLTKLGDDDRSRLSKVIGGIDDDALEHAHSLIEATFETFLNDSRFENGEAALTLRRDGSVSGAQEIPAERILWRLAEIHVDPDRETSPSAPGMSVDLNALIAWTIEAGSLIPDLFKRMTCAPDSEGLRVTFFHDPDGLPWELRAG